MYKDTSEMENRIISKSNYEYQSINGDNLSDMQQPNSFYQTEYNPHESTRFKNVKNIQGLPQLYLCREECCGCEACFSICPVHAISMENDEEGFNYPVINAEACIRCHKCINICPIRKYKLKLVSGK